MQTINCEFENIKIAMKKTVINTMHTNLKISFFSVFKLTFLDVFHSIPLEVGGQGGDGPPEVPMDLHPGVDLEQDLVTGLADVLDEGRSQDDLNGGVNLSNREAGIYKIAYRVTANNNSIYPALYCKNSVTQVVQTCPQVPITPSERHRERNQKTPGRSH
jgi:hypothetical protein